MGSPGVLTDASSSASFILSTANNIHTDLDSRAVTVAQAPSGRGRERDGNNSEYYEGEEEEGSEMSAGQSARMDSEERTSYEGLTPAGTTTGFGALGCSETLEGAEEVGSGATVTTGNSSTQGDNVAPPPPSAPPATTVKSSSGANTLNTCTVVCGGLKFIIIIPLSQSGSAQFLDAFLVPGVCVTAGCRSHAMRIALFAFQSVSVFVCLCVLHLHTHTHIHTHTHTHTLKQTHARTHTHTHTHTHTETNTRTHTHSLTHSFG